MTAWSHLPNAKHIDRVLASVRADWGEWNTAREADRDAAWVAGDAARVAARAAARAAARVAARDAARGVAWRAARDAARVAARAAARDALFALIAWDDCAYLLDLPEGAVRLIATTGNPAAVLLLPAIISLQRRKE